MAGFENDRAIASWRLCSVIVRLKLGSNSLSAQKSGTNDRYDVDITTKIVVSEVGGVFQAVLAAPSGKYRIITGYFILLDDIGYNRHAMFRFLVTQSRKPISILLFISALIIAFTVILAPHKHTPLYRLLTDANKKLLNASGIGQFGKIGEILKEGADINVQSKYGITPLMMAIIGNVAEIEVFLTQKEYRNQWRKKLEKLIRMMNPSPDTVVEIIKRGADINLPASAGVSALMLAALSGHPNIVKLLLDHGAQVDQSAKFGITPLMVAALSGHRDPVAILLENGADGNALSWVGLTPMTAAKLGNHLDVVSLLDKSGATREGVITIFFDE